MQTVIKIIMTLFSSRAKFLWMQDTSLIYLRSLKHTYQHTTATYSLLLLTLKIFHCYFYFRSHKHFFPCCCVAINKYIIGAVVNTL